MWPPKFVHVLEFLNYLFPGFIHEGSKVLIVGCEEKINWNKILSILKLNVPN